MHFWSKPTKTHFSTPSVVTQNQPKFEKVHKFYALFEAALYQPVSTMGGYIIFYVCYIASKCSLKKSLTSLDQKYNENGIHNIKQPENWL